MREQELSLSQFCAIADSWKSHIEDVFVVFILACAIGGWNLGVCAVLAEGMGAFVGAGVGVAEWVCFCVEINVGPDVLWMRVIIKFRLKVLDR